MSSTLSMQTCLFQGSNEPELYYVLLITLRIVVLTARLHFLSKTELTLFLNDAKYLNKNAAYLLSQFTLY